MKREKPGRVRRIIKFQQGWLPTGDRQFGSKATNTTVHCPSCQALEDQDHVLKCKSPINKANVRLQLIRLRASLRRIHILPSIWEVIESEILHVLGHGPTPDITHFPDSVGFKLSEARSDQARIGWINMIKGRISPAWGDAQAIMYAQQYPDTKSLTAKTFQIRLIRGMCLLFEGIWFQRNAIAHDHDKGRMSTEYDRQIKELYRRRHHLVATYDLALFESINVNDCTNLPVSTKKQWIESVHTAIKSRHGNLKPITGRLPRIDAYFSRRSRLSTTHTSTEHSNTQEG